MEIYQYPLKMEKKHKEKLRQIADKERRSLNQTILVIIDKYMEVEENARNI